MKLLAPIKVFVYRAELGLFIWKPPSFLLLTHFALGNVVCVICVSILFLGSPFGDTHTRTQRNYSSFPFYVVDLNWSMCPGPTSLVFLRVIIFLFGPTDLGELSIFTCLIHME